MKRVSGPQHRDLAQSLIERNRFRNASSESIAAVLSDAKPKRFSKGSYVYTPLDGMRFIYVIESGTVEIFSYTSGKAQKKSFSMLNRGNIFGYGELAEPNHLLYAQCLCETELLLIPKESFIEAVCSDKGLARDFLESLAHQVSQLHKTLLMDDARLKVMNYLGWLYTHFAGKNEPSTEVPRKLTYSQIGDTLFLSRETVIRTLQQLEKEGVIEIGKKSFVILRPDLIREDQQMTRTNIFPMEGKRG